MKSLTRVWTIPAAPLRFSRQKLHCVAGRPFFFTSNRGRSECVHPDTRWPLMHVAHANFLSLMRTIVGVVDVAREEMSRSDGYWKQVSEARHLRGRAMGEREGEGVRKRGAGASWVDKCRTGNDPLQGEARE